MHLIKSVCFTSPVAGVGEDADANISSGPKYYYRPLSRNRVQLAFGDDDNTDRAATFCENSY